MAYYYKTLKTMVTGKLIVALALVCASYGVHVKEWGNTSGVPAFISIQRTDGALGPDSTVIKTFRFPQVKKKNKLF